MVSDQKGSYDNFDILYIVNEIFKITNFNFSIFFNFQFLEILFIKVILKFKFVK